MKTFATSLLLSLIMIGSVAAAPGGGGSGGGSAGGGFSQSQPRKSPEQIAVENYQRGVKYRDKGIEYELAALKEDNEKKKQKLVKKAQKEYANAEKRFTKTLKSLPGAFEAESDLGFVLRKQGRYEESLAAYNRALTLNPSYMPAVEYRGEAFLALGKFEDVKTAYMTLFREDRQLADVLMAAVQLWLQNTDQQAGVSPEAKQTFIDWVEERLTVGQQTYDLSPNGQGPWQSAAL